MRVCISFGSAESRRILFFIEEKSVKKERKKQMKIQTLTKTKKSNIAMNSNHQIVKSCETIFFSKMEKQNTQKKINLQIGNAINSGTIGPRDFMRSNRV